jgi:DNA topoisomerase-1
MPQLRLHSPHPNKTIVEPIHSARAAALRYVSDSVPGIRRIRVGRGFRYVHVNGKAVRNARTLARIHALVIPPAWTDVWICLKAEGHLQATGRDAAGRKQYLYHARWGKVRDATKFDRLTQFGLALPRIRRRIRRDLRLPSIGRQRVLATIVRLLESTLIRIGNTEYAKTNGSFGLTTLRNRHVEVVGSTIRFRFHGKSGIEHDIDLKDKRLARLIKRCQELPGQELFQYLDDEGRSVPLSSSDVNDYLREISGQDFTAKDFRTWAGTVMAAEALYAKGASESASQARKAIVETLKSVAKKLGNTPAVSRKAYVHPAILKAYEDGSLLNTWGKHSSRKRFPTRELQSAEIALLRFMDGQAAASNRGKSAAG